MKTPAHFLFLLSLMLVTSATAHAQLRSRYATLQNNFQNINPAAINHVNVSRLVKGRQGMVSAQYRQQNIDGINSISSVNARFEFVDPNARVLFGGGIVQEEVHIHKTTQLSGNFSYQIDLDTRRSSSVNQRFLSLGGGGAVNFLSTDLERLRYADPSDLVVPISSTQYYTVSGGAFYLQKRKNKPTFYLGVSAFHNVGSENTPSSTQFFGIAGIIFPIANNAILLEPNLTTRYASYDGLIVNSITASPLSTDVGLRAWYDAKRTFGFFGGANIGTNDRFRLELGFSIVTKKARRQRLQGQNAKTRNIKSSNALRIGYTYDFNYKGEFRTADISEIFVTLPIAMPQNKRRGR